MGMARHLLVAAQADRYSLFRRAFTDRHKRGTFCMGGMALIWRLQCCALWCLSACLLLPLAAAAEPLRLDAETSALGHVPFEGHLEAYYDAGGALTVEQLIAGAAGAGFEPLPRNFNGGFTQQGAWWVRFTLQAAPGLGSDWWLKLGAPYVDFIDVWIPEVGTDGVTTLRHRMLGGMRPVSQRDLHSAINVLRLGALPEGEPQTVWIRMEGHRTLSLSGGAWRLDALAHDLQGITIEVAGVIGMVILMAIIALLLGISLPDRKFLWYSAYLGSSALLFICSENLLAVLFLPEQPQLAVRIHNVAMCLGLLITLVFTRSLLDMRTQFPRMARLFDGMAALVGVALLIAMAGHYGEIAPAINLTRFLTAVLSIVLCVVLVYRRHTSSWPNLIGFLVYGLAGALHFAKNLDWLPYTMITQYSYLVGMMVHMVAIFAGLGLRVRLRERQALADSLAAGARLEATVTERTRALNAEVAEHEKTEEQLRQAMDEQRNFLAMVSHEFRTPISIIGASAQMIVDERKPPNAADVQREGGKIHRATQRMTALIDTLLADEWLESSSMQLNPRELDLSATLFQLSQRYARGSGREIAFERPPETLAFRGDPMLLHILLDNLVENALKYSPGTQAIELRAWGEHNEVVFTVRDHGMGLKESETEQIFERFYRSAEVTRQPGIGLGLFMVRRIAELHGGRVQAANAPGGGAIFTVRLPTAGPPSRVGSRG